MSVDISHLLHLPSEEKLQIIGELWDSLGEAELPLPQWQIDEIEPTCGRASAKSGSGERVGRSEREDPAPQ